MRLIYTIFILSLTAFIFMGNSGGRAAAASQGNTGAPGDNASICANAACHRNGNFAPEVTISVKDATGNIIDKYVPGQTYSVELLVEATNGSPLGYGFQMVSLFDTDNSDVNSWSNPSSNTQIATAITTGRSYAEHDGVSTSNLFSVDWTAPDSGSGNITFYAAGNAVNRNGNTLGDDASATSLSLEEDSSVSTQEINTPQGFSLFPNPAQNYIILKTNSETETDGEISILNTTGKLVLTDSFLFPTGESTKSISVNHLPKGLYLLVLKSGHNLQTQKFTKL